MFFTSTTPPTDDEFVSTSGDSPVTVTLSATCATFKSKLSSTVWPTFTTTAFCSIVENP